MTEKLSRRSLFGFLGGAVAASVVPDVITPVQRPQLKLIPVTDWCPPSYRGGSTFSEIITNTLKSRSDILASNISQYNPLYNKLATRRLCDDS